MHYYHLATLVLVLANLELVRTTEIPELPATIQELPSPLNFVISQPAKSYATFWPGGEVDKTAIIDLNHVEDFSDNGTWTSLSTAAGDEFRLISPSRDVPFSVNFYFVAEAKKTTSLSDVLAALIRAFSRSKPYERVIISNQDPLHRAVSFVEGIIHSGLRINILRFDGLEGPRITEESLLQLIQATDASRVYVAQAVLWNITDAFYRDPTVKKADKLLFRAVEHNGITDETLLGLNATGVGLSNAPGVTLTGLRGHFKPVLEGAFIERSIEFKPSFADHSPAAIFKDLTVVQKTDESDQWVIVATAPAHNFTFEYAKRPSDGIYSFTLFD